MRLGRCCSASWRNERLSDPLFTCFSLRGDQVGWVDNSLATSRSSFASCSWRDFRP
jgi:hypothetical protein